MIGTLGEINMLAGDPAAPFDPVESERKVKELIAENVNKAFEALRVEFRTDMLTLNAKFDSVKAAQDINDGVIKDVVNRQALDVEFSGVKVTFDKAEALIKTMSATLQQLLRTLLPKLTSSRQTVLLCLQDLIRQRETRQ